MRGLVVNNGRFSRLGSGGAMPGLAEELGSLVVGQQAAIDAIVPYVQMYQAGLAPEGRPAGVFLLLGPSGTGKTRTAEALADVLHRNEKNVLRVDCGEFQMEHEMAKIVGAPPGYIGHKETNPLLTQARVNGVASEHSSLSVVLFDEIEKAATSLTRLLLGVLDKAMLRLGDNSSVNFERTMIFLTSNLGAKDMLREMNPNFGFRGARGRPDLGTKLNKIGIHAVSRRFAPEFINRLDAMVTYQPLAPSALELILDQHLRHLQQHLVTRLGPRAFRLHVDDEARQLLIRKGTSQEFGARELKRTLHRCVIQPLAGLLVSGEIPPAGSVRAVLDESGESLRFHPNGGGDDEGEPSAPDPMKLDEDPLAEDLRTSPRPHKRSPKAA